MPRRLAGRTAANPISKRGAAGRKIDPRPARRSQQAGGSARNRATRNAGTAAAGRAPAVSDPALRNRGTSSPKRKAETVSDPALRNRGTSSANNMKRGYGARNEDAQQKANRNRAAKNKRTDPYGRSSSAGGFGRGSTGTGRKSAIELPSTR